VLLGALGESGLIGMMASWFERVASSLSLFFDCVLVLGVAGEESARRIGRVGMVGYGYR
jgi:hypothetical protein